MKEHIANVDMLDKVDSMKPIAEKYGLSLAQLSLAWILHNPGISSVIMGATSIRQLEDNVKASGVELEQADFDQISSLFPVDGES
jgi:aryl-alcohol dehydrogenase-like predicted oxidoreductase